MTYEEAKMQIQAIHEKIWDHLSEPDREAMEMAFSALQAQDVPDTNVGDMISRQAAIDALFELYEYQRDIDPTEAADLVRQGIYLAEKKIEQLPSAQPETGHWISARDEDGWNMWLICSECKAKETNLKAKYCPVCGRKMA